MMYRAHQKGVTVARLTDSSFRVSLLRLLCCCMAEPSCSMFLCLSSLSAYALVKVSLLCVRSVHVSSRSHIMPSLDAILQA